MPLEGEKTFFHSLEQRNGLDGFVSGLNQLLDDLLLPGNLPLGHVDVPISLRQTLALVHRFSLVGSISPTLARLRRRRCFALGGIARLVC